MMGLTHAIYDVHDFIFRAPISKPKLCDRLCVMNIEAMKMLDRSKVEFAIRAGRGQSALRGPDVAEMAETRRLLLLILPVLSVQIVDAIMLYHWDLVL